MGGKYKRPFLRWGVRIIDGVYCVTSSYASFGHLLSILDMSIVVTSSVRSLGMGMNEARMENGRNAAWGRINYRGTVAGKILAKSYQAYMSPLPRCMSIEVWQQHHTKVHKDNNMLRMSSAATRRVSMPFT